MKPVYQQPLVTVSHIDTEPLLALSPNGTTLVIDPVEITDDNAANAASRHTDVWDDDSHEDF